VIIIENGVLKAFLHNKDRRGSSGAEPTEYCTFRIQREGRWVRMRNRDHTRSRPSAYDRRVISYYLKRVSNGQDWTSEFMLGSPAERIRGKLGRAIRDGQGSPSALRRPSPMSATNCGGCPAPGAQETADPSLHRRPALKSALAANEGGGDERAG
jgi:hypothetical protein